MSESDTGFVITYCNCKSLFVVTKVLSFFLVNGREKGEGESIYIYLCATRLLPEMLCADGGEEKWRQIKIPLNAEITPGGDKDLHRVRSEEEEEEEGEDASEMRE